MRRRGCCDLFRKGNSPNFILIHATAGASISVMDKPPYFGSLAEFVGKRAVEKAASWKSPKGRTFPLRLRILQQRQDFHFSHRPDDGCTFQFPLGTKNS